MKHLNKNKSKGKVIRRVSILGLILTIAIVITVVLCNVKTTKTYDPSFIQYNTYYNGSQVEMNGNTSHKSTTDTVTMTNAYSNLDTDYANKTITISSADELYKFSQACNSKEKFLTYSYKLLCNIDYDETGIADFIPIGLTTPFSGTFDGDGWDISNLELVVITSNNQESYSNISYYAMFAQNEGTIKNFGLVDPTVIISTTITNLSTNGSISNVCGLNSGTISGVYVRQLSTSLVDECGITASGEYRVSGFVGKNTGTISECYLATNSVYNYTLTDSILEFADIALENTGTIEKTYFYDSSIQNCTQTEINGICTTTYCSDLGANEKTGAIYGKYISTITNLNSQFTSDTAWRVKSTDTSKIESHYTNETPVRRNLVFETSANDKGTITGATTTISDSRGFLMMYELMNENAEFASSIMTYKIAADIDLAGLPVSAYTYTHMVGATIEGKEVSGTVTLVNGDKSKNPTIYNANIMDSTRNLATAGLNCYGLFPYLVGTVKNLNVYAKDIDLNKISEDTNNAKAIGALAGYAEGATIDNVNVYMTVTNTSSKLGEYYLGGIVGVLGGEGEVKNSTAAGTFTLTADTTYPTNGKSSYMGGVAVGGAIGYVESSLGDIDTVLSGVTINANLGSSTTYAVGGVIGAAYTRVCKKLENVGDVTVGSTSSTPTYSNLYLSGVIGRLMGESGETSDTAEVNNFVNQGTISLYGNTSATKSYISGLLNADIQSTSQFVNKAGEKLFYASSLTNRAAVNVYNTGYSDKLEYTSGVNVISSNGFKSTLSNVYNLNNTVKYNTSSSTTTAPEREQKKIDDQSINMNVTYKYAPCINVVGSTSTNNVTLQSVYNLKNITFTASSALTNNLTYTGAVLGKYINYTDVRNEGNLTFDLNIESSAEHNLKVSGVFEELSQNTTANKIYNGGNITITDSASSDIKLNIYFSGICINNLAEISNNEQKPLNSDFDSSLTGSLNDAINNGNLTVTSSNYDKTQTLYETDSSNNPVIKTQTTTTYLNGSIYAAGISYSNNGIISNSFNLGDITLDLFAKSSCNYYVGGIATVLNGENAQIRDCANNGTIQAINTANSQTAKMIVGGIVATNIGNTKNINQILAFNINYGTILAFNGTPNVARTTVDALNSYSSGILGYGMANTVNVVNYGNVYGNEVVGSIIGAFKLSDFENSTCHLSNTINYGDISLLLKYGYSGSTLYYANYNTVKDKTYLASTPTYNETTKNYFYVGAIFGIIDFNSQSNLSIRYLINLFNGAKITEKGNQLNLPNSLIETNTFITVEGSTNEFAGNTVAYAPLSTVEDESGNIGVFSKQFVFRKAIDGVGIDKDIVTDKYISDYFQFVRFDKINDVLLEKIGWQTIAYMDAAEQLAKNVQIMAVFVNNDGLTSSSETVSAAFTNSTWTESLNEEVLINFIQTSLNNNELNDNLDDIIDYILFDNECISDITKNIRTNVINEILSYYDNNENTNYYEVLQKLLYDEILAKIVSGENTDYQVVQSKIKEVLSTSSNLNTILQNYLETLLNDENILNPLFTDETAEYYINSKIELIRKLLDGYSDDTLNTMVKEIVGDSDAGSSLKYQLYLKNNENVSKEVYAYIIAANSFSGNDTYYEVFNKLLKKYDIESLIDDTASSNASISSFTDKSGSTYINGTSWTYSKDYTELWNIVKNDTDLQNYIKKTYFTSVTDPTSSIKYDALIAKATEYNSTYQSQNSPSDVNSDGTNSTSGVMRSANTVNGTQRYIYTPDDLVRESTYYFGPFDVTGKTLKETAWPNSTKSDFNSDIYNASSITSNLNYYAPLFMSLDETTRTNYINASNTTSTTKSCGTYYWNDKQTSENAWNQWVSTYIIENKPDNCNYFLQKVTTTGDYIRNGYDFSDSYNSTNDTIKYANTTSAHKALDYVMGYGTSCVYTGVWYPVSIWYDSSSSKVIGVYLTAQDQTFEGSYKGVQTTQYTYYQIDDLVKLDGVRTKGKSSGSSDTDEIAIISALLTKILSETEGKKIVLKAIASYAKNDGLTKNQSATAQMLLTALSNTDFASQTVQNNISLLSDTKLENLAVNITSGSTTYTNLKTYFASLIEKVTYTSKENLIMAGATDKTIFKEILLATLTDLEDYDNDSSTTKVTSKDLTYYIYKYAEYLKNNNDEFEASDLISILSATSASDLTAFAELSNLTFTNYIELDSTKANVDDSSPTFGGSLDIKSIYDRIRYISQMTSVYLKKNSRGSGTGSYWSSIVSYNKDATSGGSYPNSGYALPIMVSNEISQDTYTTLGTNGFKNLSNNSTQINSNYEETDSNNIGYYTGNSAKITAKTTSTNIKESDLVGTKSNYTNFNIYTKNSSGETNVSSILPSNVKTTLLNEINADLIYNIRLQNAINTSNQVSLSSITVAGTTLSGSTYYLPNSAIWFVPQQNGYVKIALSTLNDGNNGFSLYTIDRTGKTTSNPYTSITSTTAITSVYVAKDGTIYNNITPYTDSTTQKIYYDSSKNVELTLKFSSDWTSSLTSNTLYYYEIPVKAGVEYALGNANSSNGSYLLYLDLGQNGNLSNVKYPDLSNIESAYNNYYNINSQYAKYLINNLVKVYDSNTTNITVSEPTILLIKATNGGTITIDGVTSYDYNNQTISLNKVTLDTSGQYKGYYLSGGSGGVKYTITASNTTIQELLLVETDSSLIVSTNKDKIDYKNGIETTTIYKGLEYESLKSFDFNINNNDNILETLMTVYPSIYRSNTNYDSNKEYTIFQDDVFTNQNLKEIVRLLALADYSSSSSSLGKLISSLDSSYYDDLLLSISDEIVMKNILNKIISLTKSNTYSQEEKYIIAAYLGNDYLNCSSTNSLKNSILYKLLDAYSNGEYQFITGDSSVDAGTFSKFLTHLGGTSNLDGYGIYALSSSTGIKNGKFIPDNVLLTDMDAPYIFSANEIISLTDSNSSSWRDYTGASTSSDYDTSNQSSVNYAIRIEMKQLKQAISTTIFELDLDDSGDSLDTLFATEDTISEANATITYYVPSSYIDTLKEKTAFNISYEKHASTASSFKTNNNDETTVNLTGGVMNGENFEVANAITVIAQDTTVITNYKMVFIPVTVDFEVTSDTTNLQYTGGKVTLTITTTNMPDGFDFTPYFSIVNNETTYKETDEVSHFSFDQTVINNGVVSNNSATLVIVVNETLPGGTEKFTLNAYGVSKTIDISKTLNTEANLNANFEGTKLEFSSENKTVTSSIKFGRAYDYQGLTDPNNSNFYLNTYSVSTNATVSITATKEDIEGTGRIRYIVTYNITSESGTTTTYTHILEEMNYFDSTYADIYKDGTALNNDGLYKTDFTYNNSTLSKDKSSLTYSDGVFAAVTFRRSDTTPEYRIKYNLNNFYTLGNNTFEYTADGSYTKTYHGITVTVSGEPGVYKYVYTYVNTGTWLNNEEYTRSYDLPALYVVKGYSTDALLSRLTFLDSSIVLGNTVSVMKSNTATSTAIISASDAKTVDGHEVTYNDLFTGTTNTGIEIKGKTIRYSDNAKSSSITDYYAIGTVSDSDLSYYAPTFAIEDHAQIYQYTTKEKLQSYGSSQTVSDATILTNHDTMYLYVPFTYQENGETLTKIFLVEVTTTGTWNRVYETTYNGNDESDLVYTYPSTDGNTQFTTLEATTTPSLATFTSNSVQYTLSSDAGTVSNASLYMDYVGDPLDGHFWYVSYVVFSESYLHGETETGNIRYFHISIVDATNVVYFDVTLWATEVFSQTKIYMTISENIYSDKTMTSTRQISGYLTKQDTSNTSNVKTVDGKTYYKYLLSIKLQTLPKGYFYFYIDLPDGYTVIAMTDKVNTIDQKEEPGSKEEGAYLPYTSIITNTVKLIFVVNEGENTDSSKWAVSTSDIYTRKATYNGDKSDTSNSEWLKMEC